MYWTSVWEALCQACTVISLITAVLWCTRLSPSLCIISENCSLKKFTRQRPHTGKRWTWEWLSLTGLQILNPVRLPFCQMIKKIQQDKVFYFGKLKEITNQKAKYKKEDKDILSSDRPGCEFWVGHRWARSLSPWIEDLPFVSYLWKGSYEDYMR